MKIALGTVSLPSDPKIACAPPAISSEEYEQRVQTLYERAATDWVVVYGDREHCANLLYLTGYDPRFEEALFVIGPRQRYLIVGNEGMAYATACSPHVQAVLCQSMSLMGQPRNIAPRLVDVLRDLGFGPGQSVGVVGWKYLEASETDDPAQPSFVPAHVMTTLAKLVGPTGQLVDSTALLMHPAHGMRSVMNSASQIAVFEWAASRASAAVLRIVQRARPGMTESEAAALAGYAGEPLSAHVMCVSGSETIVGLRSPGARRIVYGDGMTVAIGMWGGLSCRAGLMLGQPDEAFFQRVVAPYFTAIATWWQTLRIGITGGELYQTITELFGDVQFRPALNPGHLISFDEWVHSPIRPDSHERIHSGMVLQCDIIPAPLPPGQVLNCEDTCVVADAALRMELETRFPEVWQRIVDRRRFIQSQLGIVLHDEVLPLSIAPAYLPPFWLCAEQACIVA
jgi:hypothetical protein